MNRRLYSSPFFCTIDREFEERGHAIDAAHVPLKPEPIVMYDHTRASFQLDFNGRLGSDPYAGHRSNLGEILYCPNVTG